MKELQFSTEKGNFILIEDDAKLKQFIPWDLCELIESVKNMTEEQFAEIVDDRRVFQSPYIKDMLNCYTDYSESTFVFTSAKESFESLVKSLGWHLWENPVGKNPSKECMGAALSWEQSESKTLYNPILLKKK